MDKELLELLNNFHIELYIYEGELPEEIKALEECLNKFLDEHDPVAPE